jgi:hypothetical protein
MESKFYKAELEKNGRITLTQSDSSGRVTLTRTGRVDNGEGRLFQWGVEWPVPITWEVKEKKLKIGNVKIRRNPDKENEYKMHITREGGGGKLIFDDKTLGETWRRIISSQSRWTRASLTTISLMGELGLPNLFNEIEAQRSMPQHLHQDIYLCSVDTSKRCILYKRDWGDLGVWNYLYFTNFIETVKTVKNPLADSADTVTLTEAASRPGAATSFENPLADSADTVTQTKDVSSLEEVAAVENPLAAWDDTVTQTEAASRPGAVAAVSPPFDQPDPPLIGNLLNAERALEVIDSDAKLLNSDEESHKGGGKKTNKRKRKTNKRKYKGRKRSSRNYKSKNKKYTKRRR